jgi:hypothetical protein
VPFNYVRNWDIADIIQIESHLFGMNFITRSIVAPTRFQDLHLRSTQ